MVETDESEGLDGSAETGLSTGGGGDYLEDKKGAEAEQREDGADDGDEGGAREVGL